MIVRSRAPLRIGLSGGGSDVSPYCDQYGGAVLNATIDLYAHTFLKPREDREIVLNSADLGLQARCRDLDDPALEKDFKLVHGVLQHLKRRFAVSPPGFELTTKVDAPPGSGLGTSSTLVVSIIGAFKEWLSLPLGEYDIAKLAFSIEREELKMAGGRQDQYAATFGGVNFMEFQDADKVIVNPLRIRREILLELETRLVLMYSGSTRESAKIIEEQAKRIKDREDDSILATHEIKKHSYMLKEALLTNEMDKIGSILDLGWEVKKKLANGIATPHLEMLYQVAKSAGSTGGKISGAGGGGFMVFYCPSNTRFDVMKALQEFGAQEARYHFIDQGLQTWRVD